MTKGMDLSSAKVLAGILLLGCSTLSLAANAEAQTSDDRDKIPAVVQDRSREPEPGEIIVTAQRRAESLQDVPIAITVVSGDALKENNFTGLTDVQYLAPSLKFTPSPFATSFSIRGVGSQAFDYSVEQSVGVALDDVIQTLPRTLSLNTLADIERVEVLRGPQGTLFGKNTSSGLISIVTRKPVLGEYGMEGHFQYGSRNEIQAYGILNAPLGDSAAVRIRAAYYTRDLLVENLSTGRLPDIRDFQLNAKLLWEPTDTFSIYAIGDYQSSDSDPGVRPTRSFGNGANAPALGNQFIRDQAIAAGIVPGPNNLLVNLGGDSLLHTETYGGQLTANLELGEHVLTAIGAYKHLAYNFIFDSDSSPLRALDNNIGVVDARQITQEVRLASPTGKLIEYVVGGFFYDQKIVATQQQSGSLGFLPNNASFELASFGGLTNFGVRVKNYAVFGQATIRPIEPLRVIAGARYTYDNILSTLFFSELPGVCDTGILSTGICHNTILPTPLQSGRTKRGAITGRGGVEFDLAPDIMLYATVSRGYKGAGIATVSGRLRDVRPETVWSEEVGIKSQFFDRNLTLNVTAFHSKYKNFQTQVFDPAVPPRGAFVTGNAGGVRTQGIEIDAAARPFEGLSLTGALSYVEAKFTDYQPPCYPAQTAALGCTLPGPTFDASGTPLPNAPRWTYSLGGNYESAAFDGAKIFLAANYAYRGPVLFSVGNPNTRHEGYGIVNASAGIGDEEGKVRVNLFVRNLFDKHFAATITNTTFDSGGYTTVVSDAAYRRVGVSMDLKF